MAYPCRCNKRSCQARKSLAHRPEWYVRRPKCPIPGCGGAMYFDSYRHSKGARDHGSAEICRLDCLPHAHRTDTKACRGYEEYAAKRNQAPRSIHSPIPADKWVPF